MEFMVKQINCTGVQYVANCFKDHSVEMSGGVVPACARPASEQNSAVRDCEMLEHEVSRAGDTSTSAA